MPTYRPGAIINHGGGEATYGSAVSSLLDAIQSGQERRQFVDAQKKQQEAAAREARVKGVLEDLSKVPAYKVQEYIAKLPPDLQDDIRKHGRGLVTPEMTADDYAEQARLHDFTEMAKTDPNDPREKTAAEGRRYASMFKRDLPSDQWQTAMTGNLQGTAGLAEANKIANKQQVTANEGADNARSDRELTEIKLPESVATVGKTKADTSRIGAETRKIGAETTKLGAETGLTNAKTNALRNSAIDPDTGTAVSLEKAPAVVRLLVSRDYDPMLMRRWKPQEGDAILNQVLRYDPTFSMQDYPTQVQAKKDFTSGKESTNIKAINTAIHHIATAKDAAAKLHNRSFTPWNTVANKASGIFGSSAPDEFTTAMHNALTPEMAAVFKGGGATNQEIESWRSTSGLSSSPEQIEGVLRRMAELMAGRTKGIQNKWTLAFGSGPGKKPMPPFIGAGEKAILKSYGFEVGDEGGAPAGGSTSGDETITDPAEIVRRLQQGRK